MYLNFDGPDFFLDKSLKTMSEAIKASLSKTTRFLLLDEVQLMKGWESVVNAYYSTGQYEITITGSNAKMLSSELATMLTGRYTEIEMFPLSFYESDCSHRQACGVLVDRLAPCPYTILRLWDQGCRPEHLNCRPSTPLSTLAAGFCL